ncbi:hypothetical protein PPSIR1_32994 [Plesiocystis pacifica SIR-1]|uniref:Uncharacterized protein n=1 Tax=Plesiocystis pacifica SIR-1 TaxID=391625 RepID=A6GJ30_9BACT|nr:hypothetical protein [Plesiocystis pacifica]EDM74105.1 hypothetical protein PPSIR1_32994 [Plesiocystis pacifica SIR-1]
MESEDPEIDALVAAIGERARDYDRELEDSPWAALARGDLDADAADERALEAGMSEAEREWARAAFAPLDEDERGGLVDALLAGLDDQPGEDEGDAEANDGKVVPFRAKTEAETEAETKTRDSAANRAHDPGSSPRWWVPGGMIAAAAAAILLWVAWPGDAPGPELDLGGDAPTVAVADPVPTFVLETDGGLKQMRGAEDEQPKVAAHRYQRDTEFEWILRPKLEVEGDISVRAFALVGSSGLPLAIEDLTKQSKSGSIRVAGTIGDLDLEPGRYTIALVVGRPEALPTQASEVLADGEDSGPWQVRRVDIVIED